MSRRNGTAGALSDVRDEMKRVIDEEGDASSWKVYNSIVGLAESSKVLIQNGEECEALSLLSWCITCMESMVPLYGVRYIEIRSNLYHMASQCFEVRHKWTEALATVRTGLEKVKELRDLEESDLPLPPLNDAALKQAETTLRKAAFKYGACVLLHKSSDESAVTVEQLEELLVAECGGEEAASEACAMLLDLPFQLTLSAASVLGMTEAVITTELNATEWKIIGKAGAQAIIDVCSSRVEDRRLLCRFAFMCGLWQQFVDLVAASKDSNDECGVVALAHAQEWLEPTSNLLEASRRGEMVELSEDYIKLCSRVCESLESSAISLLVWRSLCELLPQAKSERLAGCVGLVAASLVAPNAAVDCETVARVVLATARFDAVPNLVPLLEAAADCLEADLENRDSGVVRSQRGYIYTQVIELLCHHSPRTTKRTGKNAHKRALWLLNAALSQARPIDQAQLVVDAIGCLEASDNDDRSTESGDGAVELDRDGDIVLPAPRIVSSTRSSVRIEITIPASTVQKLKLDEVMFLGRDIGAGGALTVLNNRLEGIGDSVKLDANGTATAEATGLVTNAHYVFAVSDPRGKKVGRGSTPVGTYVSMPTSACWYRVAETCRLLHERFQQATAAEFSDKERRQYFKKFEGFHKLAQRAISNVCRPFFSDAADVDWSAVSAAPPLQVSELASALLVAHRIAARRNDSGKLHVAQPARQHQEEVLKSVEPLVLALKLCTVATEALVGTAPAIAEAIHDSLVPFMASGSIASKRLVDTVEVTLRVLAAARNSVPSFRWPLPLRRVSARLCYQASVLGHTDTAMMSSAVPVSNEELALVDHLLESTTVSEEPAEFGSVRDVLTWAASNGVPVEEKSDKKKAKSKKGKKSKKKSGKSKKGKKGKKKGGDDIKDDDEVDDEDDDRLERLQSAYEKLTGGWEGQCAEDVAEGLVGLVRIATKHGKVKTAGRWLVAATFVNDDDDAAAAGPMGSGASSSQRRRGDQSSAAVERRQRWVASCSVR